jgi:2-hydroxy-6-oxonona-2,4-dienedioate hydrolase
VNAGADLRHPAMPTPQLSTRGGIAYRMEGEGPPLVLLHGSAGSWRHWARNIGALSQIRTVIALDLPGYGDSVGVEPGISLDAYTDLAAAAIREICGDGGPFDLAGFSFGGQIAAGSAIRLRARARRLALLTPSGFGEPKGRVLDLPRRRDFADSDAGQREFHRRVLLAMMFAEPASADEAAMEVQAANVAGARFDGRHISWSGRMPALLADVGCPILLVYGDRDPMPYPSYGERIALCRKVRPDIRVALISGAGHWLQYERPAETNRLLTDFFASND